MLKYLEKQTGSTVRLISTLSTVLYCGAIALFFNFMSKSTIKPGFFLMLLLFIFSAAVTGTFVFGYPAYLAVAKNKIGEAINILAFTLLYSLAIILIVATLILSLAR
ncbi:MAG: hypothetical protein AAB512_03445 [Patescibacteria group bacterium]